MKLTDDLKAKISQPTEAQTARWAEAKKQHKASHEQIFALLTPDQRQTLKAAADAADHCHKDESAEHAAHA